MKDSRNRTSLIELEDSKKVMEGCKGGRLECTHPSILPFFQPSFSTWVGGYVLSLLVVLSLLSPGVAWSQSFGKNKITGQRFDWHIHRTEHFDIHYYPSEAKLVPIMAAIAEEAYEQHSEDFEHELQDRTPLILYKSHKDFQETNIILQELHEGIGGFAELFKHRIVIPFTGSLEAFREVIFHELIHIFQYDIIYQKPHARIYSGEFLYSPPIWFIEGMADYFAEDNDAIGEMVVRDASMNNNIVPLPQLHNFNRLSSPFVGYKLGQLAVAYLTETYGREKIAEILQGLRQSRTKDIDSVFKEVLGVELKEFDKAWRQTVRKRYWPLIEDRELPDLVSKNLTEESRYSHNIKPAWSPSGDIIAYVTGNEGFLEIVLMSAKTGERIERITKRFFREKYEEIRTDFGGFGRSLAWAPDGDRIAFIAKHHDANYLLEVNIVTEELTQYFELDFDNVTSPDYDGSGERIIFSALKEGQTDLYVIELLTGEVDRLTFDPFNDTHPSWHPITGEIIYTSERGTKNRLVLMNLSQGTERVMTDDTYNAISPSWTPDGASILFCSDRQGIYDIHKIAISNQQSVSVSPKTPLSEENLLAESQEPRAESQDAESDSMEPVGSRPVEIELTRLTNMMTGCFNPSLAPDGKHLLFSAYQNGKYDVYIMEVAKAIEKKIEVSSVTEPAVILTEEEQENYRIAKRKYSTKSSFALDAIFPDFSFGADGLLRSTVQIVGSDMLGNHRIGVSVMNQSSYLTPDFIAQYGFLTHRTDVGAMIYNYHEYHILGGIQSRRGILQRITGLGAYVNYPFDRYRRLDFVFSMYSKPFSFNFQTREPLDPFDDRGLLTTGSIAFVGDTTMWREWNPYTGSRYRIELEQSFPALGSQLSLTNVIFDARRYFGVGRRSTVAARLLLGGSFGGDRSYFYLGGIDTLRGYNYEELVGTRIGLLNLEVRIPFIDVLHFGWPVQWTLGGIRGIAFADLGGAWSDWQYGPKNPFKIFVRDKNRLRLDDVKASIGAGLRLQLGLFSVDFAAAWHTDLTSVEPGMKYHLGLGQAF
ncbi:MAG: BamA/TamA family outer membrane protein [Candidatus Poribacteria bacterium]|nr:BamA/TamA family outer membrane protein [Candidatus Poribacteria bacterium]